MAVSQLMCLRDDHVNDRVTEDKFLFYYCEDHRRSLEVLVKDGVQSYKEFLKEENRKDFLSTKELNELKVGWKKYETRSPKNSKRVDNKHSKETNGSLEYWPEQSDTEIPPLDLGWPEKGFYRGVSRLLVYTHPPKENAPTIKAVIRDMIQQAQKVIAVVVDLFTDREVFKDVLDAAYRRRVPVYMILDEGGVKYFLEMCEMMQLASFMLQNLRVRYVTGVGFYLPSGKVSGTLSHKYIMVDGDKVAFGSFRLTWSSLRVDRSIMTLLSGQNTEAFDHEFRELYALSEEVNLYKELSLPDCRPSPRVDARLRSNTVARKLINPKYALVVGRSPAPGELLRYGSPNPPAAGEGKEEESEGAKRMEKYLDDLMTQNQEIPEIVRLEDLPKKAIINKLHTKNHGDSKPQSSKREALDDAEETRSTKSIKKIGKNFFSFRKSPAQDREKVVEGGFVVLNKPGPDLVSNNHHSGSHLGFQSHQDLRSSGNISPTSTKSLKIKQPDKCAIS
ncbi:protein FAM83F [Ascaphus truei]|uniref:protein FAM83F n=1 Tax=Ascaphus truei TaxID=8439 RepID=UPI003F59562F